MNERAHERTLSNAGKWRVLVRWRASGPWERYSDYRWHWLARIVAGLVQDGTRFPGACVVRVAAEDLEAWR